MRTLVRLCTPSTDKVRDFSPLFLPSLFFRLEGRSSVLLHPLFSPLSSFPLPKPKKHKPKNLQVDDFLSAKNALFAALTEVDDLLDEVGCRLQREGEDLEIKLKAKAAEDAELRRKMATVAKRAEEMAERQEQHVKSSWT